MIYQELRLEDLAQLKQFLKEIQPEFKPFRNASQEHRRLPLEEYIGSDKYHILLAKKNAEVVGYISYQSDFNGRGLIRGIATAKNRRREGIGRKLCGWAISDLLKSHKQIVSRTWGTNIASISLFESLGFVRYKTIKNTRIDGSDTVWYRYQKE